MDGVTEAEGAVGAVLVEDMEVLVSIAGTIAGLVVSTKRLQRTKVEFQRGYGATPFLLERDQTRKGKKRTTCLLYWNLPDTASRYATQNMYEFLDLVPQLLRVRCWCSKH